MTPLPNAESIARVSENMEEEQPTFSSCPEMKDTTSDPLNLYCESDRLRTFANWTTSFIRADDLASAGFYYTDRGDTVKCPFCQIEVGRWETGDDPETEHRKHSPHCTFMLQKRPQDASQSSGEDSCGPFGNDSHIPEIESQARDTMLEKLKINPSDVPMYPRYSTYEERVRSFENWPISSKIPPDALSVAGFVYSKIGDRTFCFHCGGMLQLWDENDEPWIEHAHWFPKCKFVLSMRGQRFIDEARVKKHEGLAQTREEIKNAIETIREIVSTVDVDKVTPKGKVTSEGNSNGESASSQGAAESPSHFDRESRMMCLICLTEEKNTVLLPCYHMVACGRCANKLTECCVCREPIIYRQRVYIP